MTDSSIENISAEDTDVIYCTRHPKVETVITCAKCNTPICPKCMVVTPVGMKCRDCGTNKDSVLFKVRPERFLLAGITAVIAGVLAGGIGMIGGLFIIFVSVAYGYFAGSMILKASGMKRGLKLEILAGAGMVLGGLLPKLLPVIAIISAGGNFGSAITAVLFGNVFYWIVLAISTACAVSKIRYI